MWIEPISLKGQLTELQLLEADHAADLAEYAEPDIFTYHFPPPELTEAGFQQLINYMKALPNWHLFAIVLQETKRAIGTTAYIDIDESNRSLEIGFTWIAKAYQGSLVNPEIKYLMLRHAFEDKQAIRVQLKTDSRNLHSQRAIEKLGARREGILRKHMIMPDGYVRDTVMYSIIKDEWPVVKAKLELRLGYAKDNRG